MNRIWAIIGVLLGVLASLGAWLLLSSRYEFADPQFFWLLLSIPFIGLIYIGTLERVYSQVHLSTLDQFTMKGLPFKAWFRHILFGMKLLGIALLIIALARPQDNKSWENRTAEGIDIIIALDVSTSMLAQDFKPNRIEASKEVAMDFIRSRPDDRIGLVIYEGESFTQVPLTTDHTVLQRMFSEVRTGRLEGGTAIGMGLATAVSRLKDSDAKSKVVILLSDGENTAGAIHPTDAAKIAQQFGVRTYTIGVGSSGTARAPVAIDRNGRYIYDRVQVKIDEESLKQIAEETGGQYFRATNRSKLEAIYQEIDRLEKTRINVTEYSKKTEKFFPIALSGLGWILLYHLFFTVFFRVIE
ncbi:MAG: VWA domain-containing protein [Flavobacteriales bacterium]|nr:VWA domain-containing protein [Flavobacteriales bacterium]